MPPDLQVREIKAQAAANLPCRTQALPKNHYLSQYASPPIGSSIGPWSIP